MGPTNSSSPPPPPPITLYRSSHVSTAPFSTSSQLPWPCFCPSPAKCTKQPFCVHAPLPHEADPPRTPSPGPPHAQPLRLANLGHVSFRSLAWGSWAHSAPHPACHSLGTLHTIKASLCAKQLLLQTASRVGVSTCSWQSVPFLTWGVGLAVIVMGLQPLCGPLGGCTRGPQKKLQLRGSQGLTLGLGSGPSPSAV